MRWLRLDTYVGRLYLGALGATIFVLATVWLIGDFFTHVDDMAEALAEERLAGGSAAFFGLVAQYFLVQLPFFLHHLAPWVPLAAALLTLQRLLRGNELLPAVATGLSLYRLWRTPILVTLLWGGVTLANQELLLPRLAFTREVLDRRIRGKSTRELTGIPILMDRLGNRYHLERYDPHPRRRRITGLLVLRTSGDGPQKGGTHLVVAPGARYDPKQRLWLLDPGSYEERLTPDGVLTRRPVAVLRHTRLTPRAIEASRLEFPARSLAELGRLWRRTGDPVYLLALHRQAAHPLKGLLLLFLGLPFVLRAHARHLSVAAVFRALAVCGLFTAADFLCADLVVRRNLHPLLGAWLPLVLGASVAAGLQGRVRT